MFCATYCTYHSDGENEEDNESMYICIFRGVCLLPLHSHAMQNSVNWCAVGSGFVDHRVCAIKMHNDHHQR